MGGESKQQERKARADQADQQVIAPVRAPLQAPARRGQHGDEDHGREHDAPDRRRGDTENRYRDALKQERADPDHAEQQQLGDGCEVHDDSSGASMRPSPRDSGLRMPSIIALAPDAKNRYFLAPGVSGIHSWARLAFAPAVNPRRKGRRETLERLKKLTSFPRKRESILLF